MEKNTPPANVTELESPAKGRQRPPNLDDIEEAETGIWLHEQLTRIREALKDLDSDDEMLEAIDYLLEENERWIDPEVADAMRSGRFRSGEA